MSALPLLVVGAGLSGLAAAHRVLELAPERDVHVWEASERAGGWIATAKIDDFVVDLGPESVLRDRPSAMSLIARLGLEGRLIGTRPDRHGAYVVSRGALARIPEGFSLIGPGDLVGFAASDVVSWEGKARAALELAMPLGEHAAGEDESLASFVRRRFGWEVLERLAQPLAAGIYGADAEALGLLATMPRFREMEDRHGSVTRALVAAAQAKKEQAGSGARYGLFASFDGGMQVLTDALATKVRAHVGERFAFGRAVQHLEVTRDGVEVTDTRGRSERFSGVVLALASHRIAPLVRGLDAALADGLASIPHGTAATVTFAWRREDVPHALDAYGFVVPRVERRRILASTWSSEKWAGRAPDGFVLVRVFASGDDAVGERDDALLTWEALRELEDLMGITRAPLFARVVRYARAMPNYGVAHVERRAALAPRIDALPRVALAGNSLFGVGIPDAITSGEQAAERLLARA